MVAVSTSLDGCEVSDVTSDFREIVTWREVVGVVNGCTGVLHR